MSLILLIILVLLLVGALPQIGLNPYGYGPSSLMGVVLIVLFILFFIGWL